MDTRSRRWMVRGSLTATLAVAAILAQTLPALAAPVDPNLPEYQEPEFQSGGAATAVYNITKVGNSSLRPVLGVRDRATNDAATVDVETPYIDDGGREGTAKRGGIQAASQLWEFVPESANSGRTIWTGYGQLRNRASGKCLRVNNESGSPRDVDQAGCATTDNQLWRVNRIPGGGTGIAAKGSGKWLGTNVSNCGSGAVATGDRTFARDEPTGCTRWEVAVASYQFATNKVPVSTAGSANDRAAYRCLPGYHFRHEDRDGFGIIYFAWGELGYVPVWGAGMIAGGVDPVATWEFIDYQALVGGIGQVMVFCDPDLSSTTLSAATRQVDGRWAAGDDLTAVAHIPGRVVDVASAGVQSRNDTQALAVTSDGRLWHTIRRADGSWTPAGDAANAARISGTVVKAAATVGGDGNTQILAVTSDGRLWHTIRRADGSWSPAGDAANAAGISGTVIKAAAAVGANGDAQVLAVTADGRLWHTIRRANGSWYSAGDAANAARISGTVVTTAAAVGSDGNTQILAVTADGRLWHTIRRADGSWSPAGDAANAARLPGYLVTAAVAVGSGGNTHVTALAGDGGIWHTIRHADGSWDSGDPSATEQIDRTVSGVSLAPGRDGSTFLLAVVN